MTTKKKDWAAVAARAEEKANVENDLKKTEEEKTESVNAEGCVDKES